MDSVIVTGGILASMGSGRCAEMYYQDTKPNLTTAPVLTLPVMQKFTNWEAGVRVPLIIRDPYIPQSHGKKSVALVGKSGPFSSDGLVAKSLAYRHIPCRQSAWIADGVVSAPAYRASM